MKVLSLFDRTTRMVRPWAEAGHECFCVDLQHESRETEHVGSGSITTVPADLRYYVPPLQDYWIAFAFPPCTNLAVSGARWFRDKGLPGLMGGLELVERARRICEASGKRWMLENPVSTLSTYWREPDHIVEPYEYAGYLDRPEAEAFTKKTCLWTGTDFVLPQKRPTELGEDADKIHMMAPSDRRGDLRAMTPEGFARAVYEANRPTHQGQGAA